MNRFVGAALLLLGGCGGDDPSSSDAETTTSTGSAPTTTGTSPLPSSSTVAETTSEPDGTSSSGGVEPSDSEDDETGNTGTGCGFTCPPAAPPPPTCSLSSQDCPEGEKCTVWANDGDLLLNAPRCAPLARNPAGLGEPCIVEGHEVAGIDDCDLGLKCHDADHRTMEGTCVAICSAYGDSVCPPQTLCIEPAVSGIGLCKQPCHPLQDDCGPNEGCYPAGLAFACLPAALEQDVGDPCRSDAYCRPGLACLSATEIADCETENCCAAYCDLDAPECGAHSCVSLDAPLAAHATVGYCDGPP